MTNKQYEKWLVEWLKQEPWPELTGKTVAEMFQGRSGFKAQSHRTINGLVAKPKRFRVPIPARRGINSVLGEYTTGRTVKVTKYNWSTGFNYDPDGADKPAPAHLEIYEFEKVEIGKVRKVGGEYVTVFPDREENCTYEVIEGEPHYDWPPQNWKPEPVDWSAWKEARWIKTMFFSHCFQCKTEIEANTRALWNKQARLILCESDTCGKRAARERWAA